MRRRTLEIIYSAEQHDDLRLSPCTTDLEVARGWLDQVGAALDGVVAKRRDGRYEPGERTMLKIKAMRTADCVVGGFRYGTNSREVASLLLGLYDDAGLLDHVGFTSSIPGEEKAALTERLEALVEAPGFTGDAPGGPSRWSTERTGEWQPLRPELVAEVRYDHVTGRRFRHGTKFLRWRPDKAPKQCRMDQLQPPASGRRSGGRAQGGVMTPERIVEGVRLSNPDKMLYPGAGHHQGPARRLLCRRRRPDAAPRRLPPGDDGALSDGAGDQMLLPAPRRLGRSGATA